MTKSLSVNIQHLTKPCRKYSPIPQLNNTYCSKKNLISSVVLCGKLDILMFLTVQVSRTATVFRLDDKEIMLMNLINPVNVLG